MKWRNDKKHDHEKIGGGPSERHREKDHWRSIMDSVHVRISRGAENIKKMIPWAKGDNWRHNERHHHKPK